MSYTTALDFVLAREGGKVDDPADRGGRTAYGVTQRVYDHWRAGKELDPADVWDITQEEVALIYRANYWDAVAGDVVCATDPRLALALFDCAVNSGPGRAIKQLQTALGLVADGGFGPKTRAALAAVTDAERVLHVMLAARDTFYRGLVARDASQKRFLRGWLNRTNHVREAVGLDPEPVVV